jgi:endonuclease/exonuclease/phosphatase family metal-dependent hydrolase
LLWRELHRELDRAYDWFFLGDMNMVEYEADLKGGAHNVLRGSEKAAWSHSQRIFHFWDTHAPKPGHLDFLWDSMHLHRHTRRTQDGRLTNHTLRRLDRIYSFEQPRSPKFSIKSTILPGFSLSDHAPVQGTLTLILEVKRSVIYRMNMAHLASPALQSRITEM